jgi:predicted phage terminase large subunit-like protein
VPKTQLIEAARSELARRHFTAFKSHLYKRYQHPLHLEHLDAALMGVSRYAATGGAEGIYMLIAEMPPRHGKTLTASRFFPAWHLGNHPDHRIMLVSYGASLAQKNSRAARSLIASERYAALFGVTLDPASRAVDAWDLAHHEGGTDALGVLGGATGKGAHILIADDLIKNRQEAESEIIRNRTWEALQDDLLTRLEPGGAVVMFATRWHLDDPIGRMLRLIAEKPPAGPVVHLRFPALAEDGDPLGRAPGAALWPERYPAPVLRAIRDRMTAYSWNALYQQTPIAAAGGMFKAENFTTIRFVPACTQVVRFWDLAMSERTHADYTVGVKMGLQDNGRTVVLDVVRRQLEWDHVPALMADTALADGPEVQVGFEEKGYMSRAGQALAADHRLHHFGIFGYPKDKDKVTNALPFAARVGLKMVDLVEAHWNNDFLDELMSFPLGAHDDQVDAAAGAYEMLGLGELAGMGQVNEATSYAIGTGVY